MKNVQHLVVQMGDFYLFGLTFNSYQRENSLEQKYLYNGKEKQDALDLNLYDYGFRTYDPAIGRWGVVDPSAELYYDWNPFNYCANNPLLLIDLNEKEWFYYSEQTQDDPSWHWHDGDRYKTDVKDENGNYIILDGVEAVVIYRSNWLILTSTMANTIYSLENQL